MPRAVILTALAVEYLAVRHYLTDLQEEMHPQGTIYERGKFVENGQAWEVGIAEVGAGNAGAAVEAERAIAHFQPDILFFVGIAGGVKDVAIGDVVAATKVYAYESGEVEKQFFTRPALGLSTHALVQRARAEARKGEWLQRLTTSPISQPHAFIAPIAAGEKVIASKESEIFNFVRASYNDAIAVEMEGFGFLSAAFAYPNIKAIVIRGISDLIKDKNANDPAEGTEEERQQKASCNASAFAFEILAKTSVEQSTERLLLPATNTPTQRVQHFVSETCPYQGIRFFDETTKDFFFGRRRIVKILRQKLEQASFVPVIGNSGSGKSSLVRAGLISCLRSKENWRILPPITPSIDPLGQLKQALRSLFQDEPEDLIQLYEAIDNAPKGLETIATKLVEMERILLVVDQFEEVFTLCPSSKEAQRDRFIQLLTQIAELHSAKLTVVVIIRADFISACLRYESLTQLIQQQALYLPVLNQEELREVIIHPAEIQGYELEDRLVEVILEDMRQEPECLPLLQFTLTELWKLATEQEHQLTLTQYRNLGRLAGALNQRADALYSEIGKRFGEQGQLWVKRILLSLVRTGVETKDTRQRQVKADLLAIVDDKTEDQRMIARVLDRLVRERLLVTGGDENAWVDLSHEALIEGWHRFTQWRKEDRDLRRLIDRVRDVYQEWLNNQQEDQFLLMGGLLAQTQNRWSELEALLPLQIKDFHKRSVDYKKTREEEGLQSSSFIGTFIAQIDGDIKEANDQFLQILGYSREEFVGNNLRWTDITPNEYLYIDEQRLAEANQRGECTPYEKEFIRKDGSRASVKISYSLRGEKKNTFFALVLDLTERRQLESMLRQKTERIAKENQEFKEVEIALRQTEKRYRLLFESMEDGFCLIEVMFDAANTPIDYRFLEANPAFSQQTGLAQVEGETARQLLPDLEAHWFEIYGRVAHTGEPVRFEAGSDTMNRWFDVYAFRIGETESHKVAILFKDISDRKRAEQEREILLAQEQAARGEAERANRIKDEFLAVLSHELRTPLNSIIGWSKILRNSELSEDRIQHGLETIERNAELQTQLIEDLLDVSRILQGKLNLTVSPVNLALTIEASIETVRLSAEAKSIQLETKLDEEVGLVLGDSTRLQQVVWNLLTNAIKFTSAGGRVEVRLDEVGNGEASNAYTASTFHPSTYVQITVSDTGKGISSEFLPHVFESFRQADSTTTRKFGGLGLGLAIVRHLLELHGGTIQADSPGEGLGSTFTVWLPLMHSQSVVNPSSHSLKPALNLKGVQVLVVDNDANTRDFIVLLLEEVGATVISAVSADEALDVLLQFQPDVFISDISMPDMDGYTLMQQIRNRSPEQGGSAPAVALTAYAGEIDQQHVFAAGFQQSVSKPVNPELLIATIIQVLEQKPPQDQKTLTEETEKKKLEIHQPEVNRDEQQKSTESESEKQKYKDLKALDKQSLTNLNKEHFETNQNELVADNPPEINCESNEPLSSDYGKNAYLSLSSVCVLIVDDILDSLEVSAFTLEQFGAQVITASSVSEALDSLQQFKPDVLVSDIWMPGEDGYSLIQKVRQLAPEQGGQIPAIALTAYAREPDQQRAISVGFQMHLPKPVNPPSKLVMAVMKLVGKPVRVEDDQVT
ncbi:response regulator [Stenomitos frigidus]|uniref:Circadian input-output histidine kinase CikA n=1 Tax=Stenomitos frigidus ULC18 TaxID=2107698 RepID=A0A2T1ELT6_9CYAN|nr:response regulator [Stenomitos frigidus]PSB33709.1 hypothetical protein C7B82_04295 [Stenomitos frigidus ULC18]